MKEVWRVPPAGQVVHTLGWPLRLATKYREYGGSWLYPMGDDMISMGFVVGLDYADATLSAHDLLQEFKTHPFIRASSRAASGWPGARRRSRGRFLRPAQPDARAGRGARGDSAGFVDMMALKGVHNAILSGTLAAEAIYEALKAGKATTPAGLWGYTTRVRESAIWKSSGRSATSAPRSRRASSTAGWSTACRPRRSARPRASGCASSRTSPSRSSWARAAPATRSPTASTSSTSSAACSPAATRPATTSRATSACRPRSRSSWPRRGSGCARRRSTRSPTSRRTAPSRST